MNKFTEQDINDFVQAYMVAAIWSSTTEDNEPEGYNITDESELAPITIKHMRKDCIKFLEKHGHLIEDEPEPPIGNDGSNYIEMAGHDFWLTRCGHGAGFWDGDWPVNGEALSEACDWQGEFGELNLYVGDDGFVYQD